MSTTKLFDKVKDQIGYCGIWCGSCVGGSGVLQELTKKYEKIVKSYGLEQWGPKDFDFKEFTKGLASIQKMPACPGCLKGGGRDDCEIRTCARNKNITDCSDCDQPDKCEIELLQKMRKGAREAGLMVKNEKADPQDLINKWTEQLQSQWPSLLLFLNE